MSSFSVWIVIFFFFSLSILFMLIDFLNIHLPLHTWTESHRDSFYAVLDSIPQYFLEDFFAFEFMRDTGL